MLKVNFFLLFVLFSLGVTISPANAGRSPECAPVAVNLHACASVLRSGSLNGKPPPECCTGLDHIQALAQRNGLRRTCLCVRDCLALHIGLPRVSMSEISPDLEADISTELQAACGVNLGFSLDVNAPCPTAGK
ncbi:hypothetical protein NMG60_11002928 [Bertholletia excelsa]